MTGSFDNSLCTGVRTPAQCCTGSGTGICRVFCPGQDTNHAGAFNDAICANGVNTGKPCINNTTAGAPDVANCGAGNTCRPGSLFNYCVGGTADGQGCSAGLANTACGTGGICERAGVQVQFIREDGTAAGTLTPGTPKAIQLGSVFCVGNTTNPTVNSNANLPGPGATSVVGTVTLLP